MTINKRKVKSTAPVLGSLVTKLYVLKEPPLSSPLSISLRLDPRKRRLSFDGLHSNISRKIDFSVSVYIFIIKFSEI